MNPDSEKSLLERLAKHPALVTEQQREALLDMLIAYAAGTLSETERKEAFELINSDPEAGAIWRQIQDNRRFLDSTKGTEWMEKSTERLFGSLGLIAPKIVSPYLNEKLAPSPTWNELPFHDEVAAWHEDESLKRAAKARPNAPSWEAWYEIVGAGLRLCIATQFDRSMCGITIFGSDERVADGFDGQFIPSNGEPVAIVKGHAICSISTIGKHFGLFDAHGVEVQIKLMTLP